MGLVCNGSNKTLHTRVGPEAMQFEQPAELNRYVDPTIPLTWAVRWQSAKTSLHMLLCCSVLLVEQAAFRLWLNDRSLLSGLHLLSACALVPIVFIPLFVEAQIRLGHRTKRKIKLQAKKVSISPAKCTRIPWKQISAWRLQPVANAPGLTKLTMQYALGSKGKMAREWSMVLRQPEQEHSFLSELEQFRQMDSNAAPVVRCAKSAVPQTSNRGLRSTAGVALGIYLLIHGFPVFMVGLTGPTRHSDDSSSDSRFSPNERAKLKQTVIRHFSSPQQFRTFLLVVGGGLTGPGAAFYFWGLSPIKRSDTPAFAAGHGTQATGPMRDF